MSKYETNKIEPTDLVSTGISDQLRAKGWSVRDAADYLGVSRQRLYSVFADPVRARLWDCAIAGIPECTPQLKLSMKLRRKSLPKPPPKAKRVKIEDPGLVVNDIVICTKHAGIAEDGEEGWIAGLRGKKDSLQVLVRMPDGEDWFPVEVFHEFFVTNGLIQTP